MTQNEIEQILGSISYKDWRFFLGVGNPDWVNRPRHLWLQVLFDDRDTVTGEPVTLRGRKWTLSYNMTRSEIVQTALKAVLTAEEHEAREKFLYRGVALFNPHIDVDKLFEIANSTDERKS